jgi:hypothetical protein
VTRICSTAICVAKINLSLQTAAGSPQSQINSSHIAPGFTVLKHFQAKWIPVRVQKTRSQQTARAFPVLNSSKPERL